MLRKALLLLAALVLLVGLGLLLHGDPEGRALTIWGGLMLLAMLLERWRYKSTQGSLDAEWQATEERFVDPESGQTLQVYYNPRTGERRYQRIDSNTGP